jgi:hypothetical protein
MTMTSQVNNTRRDAAAKFARTIGRTALLLAICQTLALIIIGAITFHSGVLAKNTIEAPDATKNLTVSRVAASAVCAAWDKAARAAIDALAGSDVAPAQIEGAKFRLLRARRNCMAGWVKLACGDYQAVLTGPLPLGGGHWHKLDATKACTFEIAG